MTDKPRSIYGYDPEFDGDDNWEEWTDEELETRLMDLDPAKLKKAGEAILEKVKKGRK